MSNFTGQGKEDVIKTSKDNKVPSTKANVVEHPTKEAIEISPLQIVFLETGKGNASKTFEPSKVNITTIVSKNVTETAKLRIKAQDVYSNNLDQPLESMHACDKPPINLWKLILKNWNGEDGNDGTSSEVIPKNGEEVYHEEEHETEKEFLMEEEVQEKDINVIP
ncbi:unnamed protein product [Vicia faba]|uniref:Uncharacterized protein n=1 Tax=Vicia faba TaxID=3906 RepID=A0AAV0YS94_VICFA|nr:unnamed protein product [Vicia faba]